MTDAEKRIVEATKKLNAEAEKANTVIQNTESMLARLSPGIECYASEKISLPQSPENTWGYGRIGYARTSEGWKLVLRTGGDQNHGKTRPLAHCSRQERVLAVMHVDNLLEQIAEALERQLVRIEGAEKKVVAAEAEDGNA